MFPGLLHGLFTPFLGTTLGATCVFFLRKGLDPRIQKALTGFAAGVMTAASVWSLLIPAMERADSLGIWAFVPAVAGVWAGVLFLLLLDRMIPHLHLSAEGAEGPRSKLKRTAMLTLAVTLHNLPEGMAVGVLLAGWLAGDAGISEPMVAALVLGIAIQNFPEGAIISLPLHAEGMNKGKAFRTGLLSGVVEPVGAGITLLAARLVLPILPFLLSFAAGAMLFVVVEELVPETAKGAYTDLGTVCFVLGFTLMMALDVALG